jgi:hypothetical protein
MAYTKTVWEDRLVQYPNRYKDQNNTQYTLSRDEGTITTTGTLLNATLMNNIEDGIETNDTSVRNGWINPNETWAYASANTITVPSGAVSRYSKGDKIKLTQTTVKYFYITAVADTLLTITGGNDYTLTNATITSNYYSHENSPIGFPSWFNFTPAFTAGLTVGNATRTGKFTINNGVLNLRVSLIFGSTTSISSSVALIFPVNSIFDFYHTISDVIYSHGGSVYPGTVYGGANNYVLIASTRADVTYPTIENLSATVPFTWANGDAIYINLCYGV